MPRKGKSLRRAKVASRVPKPRVVIFCEGQRTEPEYLEELKSQYPQSLLEIEVVGAVGVPRTLFDKAREEKSRVKNRLKRGESFADRDTFWIVCDRDEHPLLEQTVNDAARCGIEVALSDPCFELWLLLHLEDFDKPDDRHELKRRLGSLAPRKQSDTGKVCDFAELVQHVEKAEARAQAQFNRRAEEGIPPQRPFTTMYRLTVVVRSP